MLTKDQDMYLKMLYQLVLMYLSTWVVHEFPIRTLGLRIRETLWPNFSRTLWHILKNLPLGSRAITSIVKNSRYSVHGYTCHQKLLNSDFQNQFSILQVKNYPDLSHFFFIEQYQFRRTFLIIDIFWQLQFLKHFI